MNSPSRFGSSVPVLPLALALVFLPACADPEGASSPVAAETEATQALESSGAAPAADTATCIEAPCGRILLAPGANRATQLRIDGLRNGHSRVELALIAPSGIRRAERVADLAAPTNLTVPWSALGELPEGSNAQLEVTVVDARGVVVAGPTVFYVASTADGLRMEEEDQPPTFVRDVVVIGGAYPHLEGSEGVDP